MYRTLYMYTLTDICWLLLANMTHGVQSLLPEGRAHVSIYLFSSGHVSVGGGSEGASQAFQLRITASFLPGDVGGGDRRCWISGHRQDLGHLLPNLWTQVSLFRGAQEWKNNLLEYQKKCIQPYYHWLADLSDLIIFKTVFTLFFHRHIFHLNPDTLMPEEEKHTLLENIEIEAEEEGKKPWIRIASSFIFSLFLLVLWPWFL